MEKSVRIAGIKVSFEMPQELPVWAMLSQYDPFIVPEDGEAPAFRVEYCPEIQDMDLKTVYNDTPEDPGQTRVEIYSFDGGWEVRFAPYAKAPVCGRLQCGPDFETGRFCFTEGTSLGDQLFVFNNAMMLMYAFRTSTMKTLEMHSSVVMSQGRGYMFLGKSGTGKSTHSRMWLENIEGTELLNDDNPVVRILEDGSARVYGTPWSGKTPCYRNLDVPIGGIIRIKRAPYNKATRLDIFSSYASVVSSCSGFKPMKKMADGLHETISALVGAVPCYDMECLPNGDAARVCAETVRR